PIQNYHKDYYESLIKRKYNQLLEHPRVKDIPGFLKWRLRKYGYPFYRLFFRRKIGITILATYRKK
ncbi:MAG: hypothetical protein AAF740_14445, partial [Bacteroidota bacterium]